MRRIRLGLLGLVGLLLSLSLFLALLGENPEPGYRLSPTPPAPADRTISVGMRINNIYNLSLRDKTFNADGWYWLIWPEAVQQLIQQHQIPLANLVEFTNQVEKWDALIEVEGSAPYRKENGDYLQLYSFSGKFYDDQQTLRMFPFQKLELPITLETRPVKFSMASGEIILRSTIPKQDILGDSVGLNGYSINGIRVDSGIHTGFADYGHEDYRAGDYSLLSYIVDYHTNVLAAFYTYIIPWLGVMVMLLLAPNLEGDQNDLRLAIPSTALLTLVFLRDAAHSSLPPLDYLTYLDKLYVLGYVASTVLFWLFVWGTNAYTQASTEQRSRVKQRINEIDRFYQWGLLAGMAVLLVSWFRSA